MNEFEEMNAMELQEVEGGAINYTILPPAGYYIVLKVATYAAKLFSK